MIYEGKLGEIRTVWQLGEEVVDDMTMRDLPGTQPMSTEQP